MTSSAPNPNQPDRKPFIITAVVGCGAIAWLIIDRIWNWLEPSSAPADVFGHVAIVRFAATVITSISLFVYICLILDRKGKANQRTSQGRCPRCAYNLSNAPRNFCPECGPLTAPVQPISGSPAVCARCRHDMTGREGRTCPDCGAMYGMDYLNQTPTT